MPADPKAGQRDCLAIKSPCPEQPLRSGRHGQRDEAALRQCVLWVMTGAACLWATCAQEALHSQELFSEASRKVHREWLRKRSAKVRRGGRREEEEKSIVAAHPLPKYALAAS